MTRVKLPYIFGSVFKYEFDSFSYVCKKFVLGLTL